jgi:hypothetical protein
MVYCGPTTRRPAHPITSRPFHVWRYLSNPWHECCLVKLTPLCDFEELLSFAAVRVQLRGVKFLTGHYRIYYDPPIRSCNPPVNGPRGPAMSEYG